MSKNVEELKRLINEYHQIKICKARLDTLADEIDNQITRHKQLSIEVKKEHQDITRIENQPLIKLFNIILKSTSEQLEKERQEYLKAALECNENAKIISVLEFEQKVLRNKVQDESHVIEQIERKIQAIEIEELNGNVYYIKDYKDLIIDFNAIIKLEIETEEALDIVHEVSFHFKKMINKINEAREMRNWGHFYKEKQEAKLLQKTYVDEAQEHAHLIKSLLIILKTELNDIADIQVYFKRSQVLIRGFNAKYYNQLITDWVNHENLVQALSSTLSASTTISKLKKALIKIQDNTVSELHILNNRRNELLEKIRIYNK